MSKRKSELSEATGGEAFYPKEVAEVEPIVHQVARDLRSQYTIEYPPQCFYGGNFPENSSSCEGPRQPQGANPDGILRDA